MLENWRDALLRSSALFGTRKQGSLTCNLDTAMRYHISVPKMDLILLSQSLRATRLMSLFPSMFEVQPLVCHKNRLAHGT